MPMLRYKGHPVLTVYRTRAGTWAEGDEVEVSAAEAEHILGCNADLFEVVGSAPTAPAENRAVASPKRKAAAKKTATTRKAAPKKAKAKGTK